MPQITGVTKARKAAGLGKLPRALISVLSGVFEGRFGTASLHQKSSYILLQKLGSSDLW